LVFAVLNAEIAVLDVVFARPNAALAVLYAELATVVLVLKVRTSIFVLTLGISDNVIVFPLNVYELFNCSRPFKLTTMLFALVGVVDNVN
jgi:hypothetical protein